MADKLLKSIKFPTLPDRYVIGDTSLSEAGAAADAKATGDEITNVKSALTTIATFHENRFDKNSEDTIVGKYVNGDGTYTDDAHYFVSNYIEVSKGNVVNATTSFGSSYYGGCLYDENMSALERVRLSNNTYTVNNNNAAYIRLNGLATYINTAMASINWPIPDTYTPYGSYAYQAPTFFLNDNVANPLYGKRALFNGDSICYGEGFPGGYPLMIANDNNMDIVNYAISGATITADTLTTTHWLCRSIATMSDDADYIILEGGVNDPNTDNMGSITSGFDAVLDDTTFCGAFESMLKQAILKWKGKKIGFILSPKAYSYDGSGADKTKWDNARAICEKWSVPYLDLRNMSGLTAGLSAISQMFFMNGDGVHPNEAGYHVIVPKIEAWMKTL